MKGTGRRVVDKDILANIERMAESGKTIKQVSETLGIHISTLYHWRKKLGIEFADPGYPLRQSIGRQMRIMQEDMIRLRQRIEQLEKRR